jgi:hypothetical protein
MQIMWYRNMGGSPPTWTPYSVPTGAVGLSCVQAKDIDGDGLIE